MKLKTLREQTGLSQKEIAQRIGIEYQNYNKYELGINEPSVDTLKQIADYYGVSLDYLCEHTMKESDFSYLNEKQKNIMEIIVQLNDKNADNVLYYVKGVLSTQNKD